MRLPHFLPQLGGKTPGDEGKERRGREERARLGYTRAAQHKAPPHFQCPLPCGPHTHKLAPGTGEGMPPPSPPSVKAQGCTPASMRAPCSPMLSAAVPRSLGGMPPFSASSVFLCPKLGGVTGVCLAVCLPLLSSPPSQGQSGQRAGGAHRH